MRHPYATKVTLHIASASVYRKRAKIRTRTYIYIRFKRLVRRPEQRESVDNLSVFFSRESRLERLRPPAPGTRRTLRILGFQLQNVFRH